MNEKDFIGKQVVSLEDGARVGTVKDLVFRDLVLAGLVLRGDHGDGLLPFNSIEANGPDAITIKSYTLVEWNAGKTLEPDGRSIQDLRKLSVVDAGGNMLGHFHDLTMDPSGRVDEIAVRTEGVFGIGAHETVIPGSRIQAVGPTLITVAAAPQN